MQNYHQNNCGCRQTTDYGRYSSTQYVSRPQATPCCDREDSLDGMPLAMAYVPWQIWQRIYEAEKDFAGEPSLKNSTNHFMGWEVVIDDKQRTLPQRSSLPDQPCQFCRR